MFQKKHTRQILNEILLVNSKFVLYFSKARSRPLKTVIISFFILTANRSVPKFGYRNVRTYFGKRF